MPLRGVVVAVCAAVLLPRTASAIRYEIFVEIETEEDLYDLLVERQISEATFDALLLLHQARIDLGRADRRELYRLPNLDYADVDRILTYREEREGIGTLSELVEAGVLDGTVAASLEPFVLLAGRRIRGERVRGFLRTQLRWSGRYDRLPPATALQARIAGGDAVDSGIVGTLTRNRLRRPRWDVGREALSVAPESVRFEVPKAYVRWQHQAIDLIAGTYRIGFGQRLTFDVTGQVTPNGMLGDFELRRVNELVVRCARGTGERLSSPCPSRRVARVTPDFTWTNRLTGIGLGVKLPVRAPGWLEAHVWGSYQIHRVPRAELALAAECQDPRRDDDACGAPTVLVRSGDPRSAWASAPHASIPMAFGEVLGGVNVSYFWSERRHLGTTGYVAVPRWRLEGVQLDFQEHARRPFGGAFGAIGIDAAFGIRRQDFFLELAHSFDGQPGAGGVGAVARSVTTFTDGELDFVARYYSPELANPYARPVSAPDELDGLRARDEAGLRGRVALELRDRLRLQVLVDAWSRISRRAFDLSGFARADARVSERWTFATWGELRAATRQGLLAARLDYAASGKARVGFQLQYRTSESSLASGRRQRDFGSVVDMTGSPIERLRLRVRARYDYLDVRYNHRLAQTLWAYFETMLRVRKRDWLRVRYDFRAHLDERKSTKLRAPNPEHWLWFEYLFRY